VGTELGTESHQNIDHSAAMVFPSSYDIKRAAMSLSTSLSPGGVMNLLKLIVRVVLGIVGRGLFKFITTGNIIYYPKLRP
jgi:hypothetical protein